jgi:hypothetical protein
MDGRAAHGIQRHLVGARVVLAAGAALALAAGGCANARDFLDDLLGPGRSDAGSGGGATDAGADAGGTCGPTAGGSCTVPGCNVAGDLPPGFNLTGVWIGPAGEVWAVGAGGYVGRRAPDTGGWCWCAPQPADLMTGVWGAASDAVFAVNDAGAVLRFDGARWFSYRPVPSGLNDVHGNGRDNVWVAGRGGWTARFDGTAWQSGLIDPRYTLNGVWLDAGGVVRVAGSGTLVPSQPGTDPTSEAVVLRHDPAAPAGAWTVEASFQQRGVASFDAIAGSSAADIWAVGNNLPDGAATSAWGFIAHFDGSGWTPLAPPEELVLARAYADVAPATPDGGAAWFLDGREGVRYDGSTWTANPALENTAAIDARDGVMYAVGQNGLIMRWSAASGWVVDRAAALPPATPVF